MQTFGILGMPRSEKPDVEGICKCLIVLSRVRAEREWRRLYWSKLCHDVHDKIVLPPQWKLAQRCGQQAVTHCGTPKTGSCRIPALKLLRRALDRFELLR